MSDQRIFARYKANEIRTDLQTVEIKKGKSNVLKRKNALRKIIANLTLGNYVEMILLFPDILKFWKIEDDLEVKRICHEFVRTIGSIKARSVVDAMDNISEDLRSRDEAVQIMALKTLVDVPFSKFTEEAFNFIISLVNRHSVPPNLIKTALYSLIQLDSYDHERVLTFQNVLQDIIDQHLESPTVQIAALKTLHSIHERNKTMKHYHLSIGTAFEFLEMIPSLNEWDTSTLLECLTITTVPRTHEDAYDMIDIVLPQLQHVNTSVALNSLRFIMYLLNYIDEINEVVVERLSNSVLALLEKPPELQFLILRNIILLLLSRETPIIQLDVSYFFIEYNDPIFIKDTKLECLYLLANKDTLPSILEELEQYSTDIDIQMSRKAVRAIGNLAVKLGVDAAESCVDVLLNLLEFGVDYVVQEIISVFRNILRKYPERFKTDVKILVKYLDCAQEAESKNAMIWMISNYSDILPNYIELFDTFVDTVMDETSEVQFSILNSAVKFFVRDPTPHLEDTCMKLFKLFTEDCNNPDIRSRAFMYWRLLSLARENPSVLSKEALKDIVDGELPVIELNTKLDPVILEELELNIGTITSIYLKPTTQIFRLNKMKSLPDSVILHHDKDSLKVINDPMSNSLRNLSINGDTVDRRTRSVTNGSLGSQTMDAYDKPASQVNHLKGKRKSSANNPGKLVRSPSKLMRKLSLRKK